MNKVFLKSINFAFFKDELINKKLDYLVLTYDMFINRIKENNS